MHGFSLAKNQIEDLGMICGGNVTIYIQILKPENADIISFLEEVCELFGKNENSWLLYELCGGEVAQMDIYTKARGLRRMTLDEPAGLSGRRTGVLRRTGRPGRNSLHLRRRSRWRGARAGAALCRLPRGRVRQPA